MNPKEAARQSHRVLRALMTKPMTRIELVDHTGLEYHKLKFRIDRLHMAKEVYISGWQRRELGGRWMPIYAAGEGIDAVCKLQRKPKAQLDKEYIKRLKKSGEIEHYRARRSVRLYAKKVVKKAIPAQWFSPLGVGA